MGTVLRWHLAAIQLIQDSLPGFQRHQVSQIGTECVEAIVPLLFFGAMAGIAVLFQKGTELVQVVAQGRLSPRWMGWRTPAWTARPMCREGTPMDFTAVRLP